MFLFIRGKKLKIKIVTTSKNVVLNKVIKNLNIEYINIESLINRSIKLNGNLSKKINNLSNFKQFYNFKYDGFDIGMMIISNFCRIHKVGFVNYNSRVQKFILRKTIIKFISEYEIIKNHKFFENTEMAFTFEKIFFIIYIFLY